MRQEGFGEASPEKKTVRAWSNQHEGNKSKFEDSQEAVTVDTRLRGYDVGCGYGVGVACRQARTMPTSSVNDVFVGMNSDLQNT